ncbi:hypothetical protein E2I00_003288, partial [Balaenoptera physalus]
PGSLVLRGDKLTLRCRSKAGSGRLALTKDEEVTPSLCLEAQHSPDFPLGHVSRTHGGRYRCYGGHASPVCGRPPAPPCTAWCWWGAPVLPHVLTVCSGCWAQAHSRWGWVLGAGGEAEKGQWSTGKGSEKKGGQGCVGGGSVHITTFLAPRNIQETLPLSPAGGLRTLHREHDLAVWSNALHLSKEGSLTPPQNLRLQDTAPPFQNNFTLSPVTSAHSGTYMCYSSLSTSPSLMSQPSDPLELLISALGWAGSEGVTEGGESTVKGWKKPGQLPSLHHPHPHPWGLKWYLNVLIGVSVAFVLLLPPLPPRPTPGSGKTQEVGLPHLKPPRM